MLPTGEDVRRARDRVAGRVRETPLVPAPELGERAGGEVWLKAESLQAEGSFKFRGATNHMLVLQEEGWRGGVVTASSGNHGRSVSRAARELGWPAVVVMPEDAPAVKVEACRRLGARVILHGTTSTARAELAERLSREQGLAFVHSNDDPHVVAGQGTVALEIMERLPSCRVILAPVGGGGLAAGISLAAGELHPGVEVWGVEPEGSACMYRSLQAGEPVTLDTVSTVADGLRARRPGSIPFALARRYLKGVLLVTEEEILATMRYLARECHLVAEPSGAVAAAALWAGKLDLRGRVAVAVLSGGNVDPALLCRVIAEGV
ncbi:MAG: threonine/serine dehydratase [Bacillota bacterium]|nr:threonine/serine dehydratase [Bacillota bacterium]MDI7249904.1 threonine/serine dehydratase [Bacillota bacterium]